MRKLLLFFGGILLLGAMFGALVLSGVIYDTGAKTVVQPQFFQPDNSDARRPGDVKTAEDFDTEDLRIQLISKYLTEYFFVTPDKSQIASRMANRSTLRLMSLIAVFNKWKETIAPQIQEMTDAHKLRIVKVVDAQFMSKTQYGEYWQVTYELTTWDAPNNFSVVPTVERGTLFMDITYKPGMRKQVLGKSLSQYMESGGDPAVAFQFGVRDVVMQN